jgi:hypothetical protein
MTIRPSDPRPAQGPVPGRAGETAAARPIARDPAAPAPAGPSGPEPDQVEVSEAARRLQEALGLDARQTAQLTPERMREILARLASGHYERADVRDEVLRRLGPDLAGGDATGRDA